ncbi:MAG: hypothetical protein LCH59_00870 [Proteobacteria bacterium]|nr:hypothetical protein [Pseudomonadota bacterium]
MIAATAPSAHAAEHLPALWKAEASELRRNAREARAHESATVDDFARADRLDMKADGKHECADELAASLARPASQPAATPAATPVRYFAYDGDNGDYTAPIDGWQTMESCPINTPVLLWSNDTSEKVIGYKPGDAPHPECVIVASTAAYADAWHPMPPDPEAEQEEPA